MHSSVAVEFQGCEFGDKRLTNRVMKFSNKIRESPQTSINAACGSFDQSKAAYRFFQNEKVTPKKILNPHVKQTLERVKELKSPIIIIQDTTTLTYSFPTIKNLGIKTKLKGFKDGVKGVELHTSLAVNSEGIPLGILKQTFFTYEEIREKRGQIEPNLQGSNRLYPIEQKTSFRWIDHLLSTNLLTQKEEVEVIHVADRECDIYEFLQTAHEEKLNYVLRSSSNRRIYTGKRRVESSTIEKNLSTVPVLGSVKIQLKSSHCKLQEHVCDVKSCEVMLYAPLRSHNSSKQSLKHILVHMVEIKEINKNSKNILHWRILTNLECSTYEKAIKVADIYKMRWSIECFHRILKSGFGVEKSRLSCRERIEKLASILSVVSWHLFWVYMLPREYPDLSASLLFSQEEIKILKISAKKLKVKIPQKLNIQMAVLIIARLGGFLGRKYDGLPGMEVIWRGWKKLYERIEFMKELTYG